MGVEREYIMFFGVMSSNSYEYYPACLGDTFPDRVVTVIYNAAELSECRDRYDWRKTPKFICESDGMNGEFSFMGIAIKASGQDRWGEEEDLDESISLDDFHNLAVLFNLELGKRGIYVNEQPKLHIIRYYT